MNTSITNETNVDDLQTEVNFYRQNQTVVEEEIRKVIEDNQKLSKQVENLVNEKLNNVWVTQAINTDQYKPTEELEKQIVILTKERDSLHVLWQTSQKTIDALENELKEYQSYDGKQDMYESVRDLQLKLDTALQDYVDIEAKFKSINNKCHTLENELKANEKEILSYKERGKSLDDRLKEVSADLEECKINLAVAKKSNEELRDQLRLCQKERADKLRKELEAKSKVAEALQLFDVVSTQKSEALRKVADLSGELHETKRELNNVRRKIESKYRIDLEEMKEKYNEKLADMLQHIRNLDTDLMEKGMLLNKTIREKEILQSANEIYLKQQQDKQDVMDPKLVIAEQKLETMYQELVASERKNIQLVSEKQCLAIDIQRIQDMHLREIKRRDWEEGLLKSHCEELKLQVKHLRKSLNDTHNMINKLQVMLSSRTELGHRMVTSKEQDLVELNKHLESQMELNKKWKATYVEMTEKLKKRLLDLQIENRALKEQLCIPVQPSDADNSTS